jgi:ferric-chelate reductase [NAD(P)H]
VSKAILAIRLQYIRGGDFTHRLGFIVVASNIKSSHRGFINTDHDDRFGCSVTGSKKYINVRRFKIMETKIDRSVFRDLSYGLYIVTSKDGDRTNCQIVNTIIQVTSEPPRIAVIINKKNFTLELIEKSKVFSASVLEESSPMTFFGPLGFRSGRDFDKLSNLAFKDGITGCPLITQHALSVLEAEVINQIDLGSHTVFVGNVVSTEVLKEGTPLTYDYYHNVLRGKSPPNAPTYEVKK